MPTQPSRYRLTRDLDLIEVATGAEIGFIIKHEGTSRNHPTEWAWRRTAHGARDRGRSYTLAGAKSQLIKAHEAAKERDDADAA